MLINEFSSQPLLQFRPEALTKDFARSSSPSSHPHGAILQLKATFSRTSLGGINEVKGKVASRDDASLYSLSTPETDSISIKLGRVPNFLVPLSLETSLWLLRRPLALLTFEHIHRRVEFCCIPLTAQLVPLLDHTLLGVVSHFDPKSTPRIIGLMTCTTPVKMLVSSRNQPALEEYSVSNSFRDSYYNQLNCTDLVLDVEVASTK